MSLKKQEADYRIDLQGLRAIAVILVILAHAGSTAFSGGFVGVDVFFVLSGYLITRMLLKEHLDTRRINFVSFIAKRLKRLLPALGLMIVTTVAVASIVLTNYELRQQTASAIYAAAWISNLFFAFSKIDYFQDLRNSDLFLHTWSLGVEEQFYLLWPLLILLLLSLRRHFRGSLKNVIFYALTALGLISAAISAYWTMTTPTWAFYLMPSRIWQFCLGAAISAAFLNAPYASQIPSRLLRGVGLALIVGSAIALTPQTTYPGAWALLPSLGTALVIATHARDNHTILAHPVLVWIGNRSYSWYLWHWPVLILGAVTLPLNGWMAKTILIGMALVIASLCYRYVELPFWKGRFSQLSPKPVILLGFITMLAVMVGTPAYLANQANEYDQRTIAVARSARADMPPIYQMGCDSWDANADLKPCVFGPSSAKKTVVLLGDSIGAQWFSMLPQLFPAPEWSITVLTRSACPIVDEDFFSKRIGKTDSICSEWRQAAISYVQAHKPEAVFIGSSSLYPFSKNQWTQGSARIFERLSKSAPHIIVIPGTPVLSFHGPSCLERYSDAPTTAISEKCSEPANALASVVSDHLHAATTPFDNIRLLDLNDLVCPNQHCRAIDQNGVISFRDAQHLTNSFVLSVWPEIQVRLHALGVR